MGTVEVKVLLLSFYKNKMYRGEYIVPYYMLDQTTMEGRKKVRLTIIL